MNTEYGRGWVDVSTRGTFIQADPAVSTINDGSVNKWKWGRYGRLWVRVRHRGEATSFFR